LPPAQQPGDLAGVDAIVLRLAAVDGFHVQGVAKHERDVLVGTEIGDPVPGEHALGADDVWLEQHRPVLYFARPGLRHR
jgi:hypothetical protein